MQLTISDAVVAQLVRERLTAATVHTSAPGTLPAIGEGHSGGQYAGLTISEGAPHLLVLLPGDEGDLNWEDAKRWAAKQGGALPSRIDQLVLFANLKSEFKADFYWSGEQRADEPRYAWYQNFGNGRQDYSHTNDTLRARAVRRLPLSNSVI